MKNDKPIILSTGARKISEIKKTINFIKKNSKIRTIILHCVLSYPTNNNDALSIYSLYDFIKVSSLFNMDNSIINKLIGYRVKV